MARSYITRTPTVTRRRTIIAHMRRDGWTYTDIITYAMLLDDLSLLGTALHLRTRIQLRTGRIRESI